MDRRYRAYYSVSISDMNLTIIRDLIPTIKVHPPYNHYRYVHFYCTGAIRERTFLGIPKYDGNGLRNHIFPNCMISVRKEEAYYLEKLLNIRKVKYVEITRADEEGGKLMIMIDGDNLIRYLQDYKYSFTNSKTAREYNVLQNVCNFVIKMMADTESESDNTTTYVPTEISLVDAWYKCSKCGYNHYAVCAEPNLNYCHGCGRLIIKTNHKKEIENE